MPPSDFKPGLPGPLPHHASEDASAAAMDTSHAASGAQPGLQPGPDTAAALRCYLVEDSPLIRQNLIATLEEMIGAEVIGSSEDEAGALRWVHQQPPPACDLMIIDIFLKSGSGLEVLRQARTARPGTLLVVLSNYATPDMRRRCLQLGADKVFDKSAELEELLAYCEELFRHRPKHG